MTNRLALRRLKGKNMQRMLTMLGSHNMWKTTILMAAIAATAMSTWESARAEPARPTAAPKLTYFEYRRGLFALSKIEAASNHAR